MSKFEESRWADSEFSQNYRDEADIYLPFRHQFIEVTKSLYAHFINADIEVRILDLGCGDGLFIQKLLKSFSPASVTLVDGSAEMLEAAKKRLGNNANLNFIKASFQDLLSGGVLNESFDFIYSSLAIHHLPFKEKKHLYTYIHKLLSPGGCFVHYDVVVPPSREIEKWYLSLWRQWIEEHPDKGASKALLNIPEQYKENPDNTPDTLKSQLEALEEIGFKEVDCYFKYGNFSLFGGIK
ncbi:MAG: class I SAM-dependent methyltransferase [Desulfobacterales bacterium]|uniref:Class I SAM-dependent methyltransferase n=1 Tax=Candidatus Desulfatibia profunda TaxID=2841695 RepID=A0A8J6TIL5_9BACT|nr:class I SAM-dependent methyltransferase [Candidatus Desulfatibia profunda]MBL7180607.1 class I SAM-dependent methyltransferase [Desulfobacterales bacterium]